jgi:hypothetical protein
MTGDCVDIVCDLHMTGDCRYFLWFTYGSDDCVDIVCDLPMTLVTVSIFSVIYIWLWWLCRYCLWFTYDCGECVDNVCDLHMTDDCVNIVCDLHDWWLCRYGLWLTLVTVSILSVTYIWFWWLCRYCRCFTYDSGDCVDIVCDLHMTLITVDIVWDLHMTAIKLSLCQGDC